MENISGITKIEITQVEHVADLQINPASKVEQITFADGRTWQPFYFTPRTASVDIGSKLSDAGTIYTHTLKLKVPKDRPEPTTFIRSSQGCWYLVRVTDGNGIIRLIGTLDFPARFSSRIAVPATPSGYNGYEITFISQQTTPPAYFEN